MTLTSIRSSARRCRTVGFVVAWAVVSMGLLPGAVGQPAVPEGLKPHKISGEPLKGLRVAVDVGHSEAVPGAISARGVGEFSFNVATANVVARRLEKAGAKVILINGDGRIRGLLPRTLLAAKAGADCFLSIHHDSVNNKYKKRWMVDGKRQEYADNFRGYSVFASELSERAEESRALATHIGEAIHQTGLRPTKHHNENIAGENRPFIDERSGVYEFSDLVVLKSATMPAVLLECGVIVHREEELLVKEPWYRELLAGSLVKALTLCVQSGVLERSSTAPPAEEIRDEATSTEKAAPIEPRAKRKGILRRLFAPRS